MLDILELELAPIDEALDDYGEAVEYARQEMLGSIAREIVDYAEELHRLGDPDEFSDDMTYVVNAVCAYVAEIIGVPAEKGEESHHVLVSNSGNGLPHTVRIYRRDTPRGQFAESFAGALDDEITDRISCPFFIGWRDDYITFGTESEG